MSTHYTTEPTPTASVLLHTSAGPIPISLFAAQAPLTCRNFLQLVLDGYYDNVSFHRISPGFVLQTGDPTGTGEGGESIYERMEFEQYDEAWARHMRGDVGVGDKVVFKDEVHGRLKFNRRGLVGMAKMDGGGGAYGSQFFVTLGDVGGALNGKCTMFGRVEGEGIYNVVKISEGELAEGSERPVFPERILRAEVLEMPKGEVWEGMKAREKVKMSVAVEERGVKRKKDVKKKGGKGLLSFGGDDVEDGDADVALKSKKPKFNTALIDGGISTDDLSKSNGRIDRMTSPLPTRGKHEGTPSSHSEQAAASNSTISARQRKPSFHDSSTQLPLRDPESPSRPGTPEPQVLSSNNKKKTVPVLSIKDEISALKASLHREVAPAPEAEHKKSTFEELIPATSLRGRRRPRPGETNSKEDARALSMLHAFQARLDATKKDDNKATGKLNGHTENEADTILDTTKPNNAEADDGHDDDDEATLCDLHFIANCQSCSKWDNLHQPDSTSTALEKNADDEGDETAWLSHTLSFAKDRLGKDLNWKRKNEEELVVIDPREKERNILDGERERKGKFRSKGKAR